MNTPLVIVQMSSAILMMLSILLQQRGTGLGAAFGGSSNVYRSKRGVENVLYWITVITAFIFVFSSFVNLLFAS